MGQIILWTLAAFFVLQLLGCREEEIRYYKVNREVVACRWIQRDNCGITIRNCLDGRRFHCLKALEELPAPGKQ